MYTIQSLWTMAREQLDVTVIVFNNRSYAILNIELERVGARAAGARAKSLLDLANPNLDFVSIGDGMGVPSVRVGTGEEFTAALELALAEPGPHLIEAVVPSVQSLEADGHAAECVARPMTVMGIRRRLCPLQRGGCHPPVKHFSFRSEELHSRPNIETLPQG